MYVYAYQNANQEMLYIGSTRHVLSRFQQHKREDPWMTEVTAITIWGPYDDCTGLLSEKVLLAKMNPRHNTNMAEKYTYCDAPILHEAGLTFPDYKALKKHFDKLPSEPKLCTFYLLNEDYEALRTLSFHCGESISEMVQDMIREAIIKKGAKIHHPNIYEEARKRLITL